MRQLKYRHLQIKKISQVEFKPNESQEFEKKIKPNTSKEFEKKKIKPYTSQKFEQIIRIEKSEQK